jgi:hypothetical protein
MGYRQVISVLAGIGAVLTINLWHQKHHLMGCPTGIINAQSWQSLPLPYGPFGIRVPPGASRNPVDIGWSGIAGPGWDLAVAVVTIPGDHALSASDDKPLNLISHTFANDFSPPIPPSIVAIGASYCTDTVAGRSMHIRVYQSRMYWGGPFIADAAWPVTRDSWLTFAIATRSAATRDTMLAVLRSLQVDSSAAMLALVHPHAACPTWSRLSPGVWSQRRYVGPVTFDVPANLKDGPGNFTAGWDLPDGSGLRFFIIQTTGWQLPQVVDDSPLLPQGVWVWCQMKLHGPLAEFLVDTNARSSDDPFAQGYSLEAFMRLATDSVLAIRGFTGLTKSDTAAQRSIRELFQILASARISSHP